MAHPPLLETDGIFPEDAKVRQILFHSIRGGRVWGDHFRCPKMYPSSYILWLSGEGANDPCWLSWWQCRIIHRQPRWWNFGDGCIGGPKFRAFITWWTKFGGWRFWWANFCPGMEIIRRHVADYISERDGNPADWRNVMLCAGFLSIFLQIKDHYYFLHNVGSLIFCLYFSNYALQIAMQLKQMTNL